MIHEIGTKFPIKEQFGCQEHQIYNSIKQQIEKNFPLGSNLMINLTWFGPQFNNGEWQKLQTLISNNKTFDRLFWICIVDPSTLLPEQISTVEQQLQASSTYYIGPAFTGEFSFNTHSIVCVEEFPDYTESGLLLTDVKFLYLNYNRKPKPHRIRMVELLHEHKLEKYGVITLGKNDVAYDVSQGVDTQLHLTIEDSTDYTRGGKFSKDEKFGRVPYDLCSLGNIDIWQNHFLNIISETEFFPWDTVFVTEKTLKPIIGLRPFLLNGQIKIYQWLRDNGFKTFNHYFPGIELENIKEFEVHDSIIEVLKYLATLDKKEILAMYNNMLPDLKHNRDRFFDFAQEQKYKIGHLFE
jgi:hypothetical protein